MFLISQDSDLQLECLSSFLPPQGVVSYFCRDALEAMTDEEIDYSDIPPLTDEFFEKAVLKVPAAQADNLIQLDSEVMEWFRSQGTSIEG
jgi:hypothetical protein